MWRPVVVMVIMVVVGVVRANPVTRQVGSSDDILFTTINDTEVCVVDGTVHQPGQYLPTADPCEQCMCRPPGFACTLLTCPSAPQGCKPMTLPGRCCPEYHCDCEKDGVTYHEGETITDPNNLCEMCLCEGGWVVCSVTRCPWRYDCEGRYTPGNCCPSYLHCDTQEKQSEATGAQETQTKPLVKTAEGSTDTPIEAALQETVPETNEAVTELPEVNQADVVQVANVKVDAQQEIQTENEVSTEVPIEAVEAETQLPYEEKVVVEALEAQTEEIATVEASEVQTPTPIAEIVEAPESQTQIQNIKQAIVEPSNEVNIATEASESATEAQEVQILAEATESQTSAQTEGQNLRETSDTQTEPPTEEQVPLEASEAQTEVPNEELLTAEALEAQSPAPTEEQLIVEASEAQTPAPAEEQLIVEASEAQTTAPAEEELLVEASEAQTPAPAEEQLIVEALEAQTTAPAEEELIVEASEAQTPAPAEEQLIVEASEAQTPAPAEEELLVEASEAQTPAPAEEELLVEASEARTPAPAEEELLVEASEAQTPAPAEEELLVEASEAQTPAPAEEELLVEASEAQTPAPAEEELLVEASEAQTPAPAEEENTAEASKAQTPAQQQAEDIFSDPLTEETSETSAVYKASETITLIAEASETQTATPIEASEAQTEIPVEKNAVDTLSVQTEGPVEASESCTEAQVEEIAVKASVDESFQTEAAEAHTDAPIEIIPASEVETVNQNEQFAYEDSEARREILTDETVDLKASESEAPVLTDIEIVTEASDSNTDASITDQFVPKDSGVETPALGEADTVTEATELQTVEEKNLSEATIAQSDGASELQDTTIVETETPSPPNDPSSITNETPKQAEVKDASLDQDTLSEIVTELGIVATESPFPVAEASESVQEPESITQNESQNSDTVAVTTLDQEITGDLVSSDTAPTNTQDAATSEPVGSVVVSVNGETYTEFSKADVPQNVEEVGTDQKPKKSAGNNDEEYWLKMNQPANEPEVIEDQFEEVAEKYGLKPVNKIVDLEEGAQLQLTQDSTSTNQLSGLDRVARYIEGFF